MNDPERLSACPLTIHSLLHIAWGIRVAGPVGGYWAYAMERHCNTLLPAVRSRLHPYTAIANCVTAVAQINQIRLLFNVPLDLNPPPVVDQKTPPFTHAACKSCFTQNFRSIPEHICIRSWLSPIYHKNAAALQVYTKADNSLPGHPLPIRRSRRRQQRRQQRRR
ncbi:hypothetical protein BJ165DRAFT_1349205 [Panaeolus papilionaceus]|nr:hypothetical protein BJ165DRAFT_1349205 [Panaeolus papilionaceus]